MKIGLTRILPLAFAGLLLFTPALCAQDLTIFAGGMFPGNANPSDVPTMLDNGPIFGVRLSTGFAVILRLEHTLAFSNDFLFPHNEPGVTSAKGLLFNSNLLVNIPAGKAVPYVTAGLGFIRQYGSSNLPVGTKFAVNYGGGLKFLKLFGPAGLRFDARGYTATGVFSHSVNMFELTAGIIIGF